LTPSSGKSPDGWKKAAELFNKSGEAAQKKKPESNSPITITRSNFQPAESLGGKLPYDYLLATCDKKFSQIGTRPLLDLRRPEEKDPHRLFQQQSRPLPPPFT